MLRSHSCLHVILPIFWLGRNTKATCLISIWAKYVETKKYARMIEFLYSNALRNEAINILYYISPAFRLHKCIKMQRLWLFSFNFSEAVTFSMYMGQSNYLFLVQDLDKMVSSFQISFMSEIYTYLYTWEVQKARILCVPIQCIIVSIQVSR